MAAQEQDIVAIIKEEIEQFGAEVTTANVGTVVELGDGIARVHGLSAAKYNELLQFPHDIMGLRSALQEGWLRFPSVMPLSGGCSTL